MLAQNPTRNQRGNDICERRDGRSHVYISGIWKSRDNMSQYKTPNTSWCLLLFVPILSLWYIIIYVVLPYNKNSFWSPNEFRWVGCWASYTAILLQHIGDAYKGSSKRHQARRRCCSTTSNVVSENEWHWMSLVFFRIPAFGWFFIQTQSDGEWLVQCIRGRTKDQTSRATINIGTAVSGVDWWLPKSGFARIPYGSVSQEMDSWWSLKSEKGRIEWRPEIRDGLGSRDDDDGHLTTAPSSLVPSAAQPSSSCHLWSHDFTWAQRSSSITSMRPSPSPSPIRYPAILICDLHLITITISPWPIAGTATVMWPAPSPSNEHQLSFIFYTFFLSFVSPSSTQSSYPFLFHPFFSITISLHYVG